jgi:hypothetical protein
MVWAAAGDADFGTGDVVIARVYSRIEDYASETWRQRVPAWPICRIRLSLPWVRAQSGLSPDQRQCDNLQQKDEVFDVPFFDQSR